MTQRMRRTLQRSAVVAVAAAAILGLLLAQAPARTAQASSRLSAPLCTRAATFCTETQEPWNQAGTYTGHDEPSTLFYSNGAGSGNNNLYLLRLPTDPPKMPNQAGTGGTWNFQLHPAFWFGMAMCDTQSFPEQVSTCAPDSDSNIVDPAVSPAHPGMAFMEMQFYPPGWAPWPAGNSCDATKWCAALNVDSLSENPVTGQVLNPSCAAITGLEYVNFAFITKNGVPQPNSPANPVNSTIDTFTPNPSADLFMNSGDLLAVYLHDTQHGLRIDISDLTSGQHGSMTASAANSFGQVQFDPTGTSCNNIPYDFHPMYSTSSEQTRVTWAAHSYNVAFSDEIGHFDYCSNVNANTGTCAGLEGAAGDQEPTDGDDVGCFPPAASTLVQIGGCLGTNTGFDGTPYQQVWPGTLQNAKQDRALHPSSILFTSPLYNLSHNYDRVAFEADLPRIEFSTCHRSTGAGCTLIPTTDDGTPANFYPFFTTGSAFGACYWQLGGAYIPGTTNTFGGNAEYGSLLSLDYTALGGGATYRYNDFRQVLSSNPCAVGFAQARTAFGLANSR